MKATNKIDKVIEHLGLIDWTSDIDTAKWHAKESAKLLREFLKENVSIPKGALRCKDFVIKGKDANMRPSLACVYHDAKEQVAVACDCHILYASKDEYIETEGNGLRDVYGEVTPDTKDCRDYPNWRGVMPSDINRYEAVTVRDDLEDVMKTAAAAAKMQGAKRYSVCIDGMHWISSDYLKYVVKAGLDGWMGLKGYQSDKTDRSRAIYKRWDGQEILIMPVLAKDENDMTDEEKAGGWFVIEK